MPTCFRVAGFHAWLGYQPVTDALLDFINSCIAQWHVWGVLSEHLLGMLADVQHSALSVVVACFSFTCAYM